MKEFLQNYEKYIDIATNLIFVVLSILLFFKTKDTKYLLGVIEEMNKEKIKTKGQTFDNLVQVYRLNKSTNILEPTDDFIDVQELVNSSLETSLDRMLNRLMPIETAEDTIQDNIDIMEDKLDTMASLINIANEYRTAKGLSADLSIEEVYKSMQNDSETLKVKLAEVQSVQAKKEEIKKEVLENEKI